MASDLFCIGMSGISTLYMATSGKDQGEHHCYSRPLVIPSVSQRPLTPTNPLIPWHQQNSNIWEGSGGIPLLGQTSGNSICISMPLDPNQSLNTLASTEWQHLGRIRGNTIASIIGRPLVIPSVSQCPLTPTNPLIPWHQQNGNIWEGSGKYHC